MTLRPKPSPKSQPTRTSQPDRAIVMRRVDELQRNPANARTHPAKQIEQIARSINKFGFNTPILHGTADRIIAGHGRLAAAELLGLAEVPTISLAHLSPAKQRAYAIADNRIAQNAGWDAKLLQLELQDLAGLELDFDLEVTGIEGAELDAILFPDEEEPEPESVPDVQPQPVTQMGDVWLMDGHRMLCGDAREPASYAELLGDEQARMVFTDPPYNVPVDSHVRRRDGGHREFVEGAGEMSPAAFEAFLTACFMAMQAACLPGAILFSCMDWRHIDALTKVGAAIGLELKNLPVWVKANAGMGHFYRSQHELIACFKKPGAAHVNTFGLGGGRHRTNVWNYPGVTSFGAGRSKGLKMHPTVKPSAMIADAIRDVSHKGEVVLDPFGGSGSTLIAAAKTGRRARLIELDPLYCDVTCRRWAEHAGKPAVLAATGETFDEVAASRAPTDLA